MKIRPADLLEAFHHMSEYDKIAVWDLLSEAKHKKDRHDYMELMKRTEDERKPKYTFGPIPPDVEFFICSDKKCPNCNNLLMQCESQDRCWNCGNVEHEERKND